MSSVANTAESSTSDASAKTAFSDFLQRRVNSEVPIFGGNIRNGAEELSAAISTSLSNQMSSVSVNIGSMLKRLEQTVSSLPKLNLESTAYRIRMMDLDPTQLNLSPAYELDDTRLHYLLDASEIEVRHTRQYFSLLSAARTMMRNQADERHLASQVENKQIATDWYVTDQEIEHAVEPKQHMISKLAVNLQLTNDDELMLLNRAVTHPSTFEGRETNNTLSMIGLSALTLLLQQSSFGTMPSSDLKDLIVVKFSSTNMSSIGLRCSLDRMIVTAPGIDVKASEVLRTTLLAIIGAVYRCGGMQSVERANSEVFSIV